MDPNSTLVQEFYSEEEAADALAISLERLHYLLDQHIFNDGTRRPPALVLRRGDVVLLEYWHRGTCSKVLAMPRREW